MPKDVIPVTNIGNMTLLDWFAGMAMQKMVENDIDAGVKKRIASVGIIGCAYEMADEMMREREKWASQS
jgi:hypothetical protein